MYFRLTLFNRHTNFCALLQSSGFWSEVNLRCTSELRLSDSLRRHFSYPSTLKKKVKFLKIAISMFFFLENDFEIIFCKK